MQPPPLAQVERPGDFGHDKGHRPVPERFFGHRQTVGLIRRAGQQKMRRVKQGGKADRVSTHRCWKVQYFHCTNT